MGFMKFLFPKLFCLIDPITLSLIGAGASYGLGKLFGGKKKNNVTTFEAPPYTGQRPFAAGDVGFGAEQLKPLSQQFIEQILRRSRGEGLVGFDPRHREQLRSEFTQDLGQAEEDARRRRQSQASSQGLRGGVPLDLAIREGRDFSRARASGLADIDIADLEARRQDINAATFAQPDTVGLGAGIQQNRANFDLAEYNATQPTHIVNQGGQDLSGLGQTIGGIGGLLLGGPQGAAIGSTAGGFFDKFGQTQTPTAQPLSLADSLLKTPGKGGFGIPQGMDSTALKKLIKLGQANASISPF